ncbi:MAG: DNA repair protein RadA [Candidatus Nomurabacteria bacterium]|jgi:DNA repair protein RadA/Sms|nr:DNA repair protein RadA [Candidatus Nomurabacteria bacterium]
MAKSKTKFVCSNCGSSFPKWLGQCSECEEWGTLSEQAVQDLGKTAIAQSVSSGRVLVANDFSSELVSDKSHRLKSGFDDLDEVLGGGFLLGGISLIAGQPGIGKSTLLLQIANFVSQNAAVLYVSGEESAGQVKARAVRLGGSKSEQNFNFVSSNSANDIAATIATGKYQLVIVDSIQTLTLNEIASAPGTVSQVSNSGNAIIRAGKSSNTSVILVGHVTKDGTLAGPKVLEHLVDTVLHFDGDRYGGFKTVRAVKNRFGATSETAIYEMTDKGLASVKNPSAVLLAERQNTDGSVILATIDGTRPILVEIQALVNPSNFGYPKRTASGFDINRLNLLLAVLERRTKLKLSDKDVFVNVVGGLKINDAAADLAVIMAVASACAERKLSDGLVVFGEVGLGGEVRSVTLGDRRIAEAKKLGFQSAIAPKYLKNSFVLPVSDLREALIKYTEQ